MIVAARTNIAFSVVMDSFVIDDGGKGGGKTVPLAIDSVNLRWLLTENRPIVLFSGPFHKNKLPPSQTRALQV